MTWLDRLLGREPGRGPEDWMCTASGRQYFPANPRPQDVCILDIAHHLSRICRYTGAVKVEHYSVAEHVVHVSFMVPPRHALTGLMHDSPEAYLNDMSRPTKRSLPDYRRLEALNWRVIADVFGLPYEMPLEVKRADWQVYLAERKVLMPLLPAWAPDHDDAPAPVSIQGWSPNVARARFLDRYNQLTTGLLAPVRPWPGRPRVDQFARLEPICA